MGVSSAVASGAVGNTVFESLESNGQQHLLEEWDLLEEGEKAQLSQDLQGCDFDYVQRIFKASMEAAAASSAVEPYPDVLRLDDGTAEERKQWRRHGLGLIAQGKAAILLLAGGQGTRLGSALPKGCYDVGLPSHKSLFQIQAERVLKLQRLAAAEVFGAEGGAVKHPLLWFIMTSPFTHADTLAHFESHAYFGLEASQIKFFQQGSLPCLTNEGKVIVESRGRIARAPDGNGGVYLALQKSGALDAMAAAGVEAVDCYCVDNCLARLGDPLFVGYCHSRGASVGARVVAKAYPEEKVGVFASRDGALSVVEYSELDPATACATDPATGKLLYNWSNICMHYFSREWLQQVAAHLQTGSTGYHIARKNIPSKSGPVPGIKLELFIFDTFHTAGKSVALMEVERAAEFAPVKNAPGSISDSPDTARAAVLTLHAGWVKRAGGQVTAPEGIEVSPLVSYAGEGLEGLVAGKTFESALEPQLQGTAR